ncbi:NACHT domain-containing protein [Candidatus Electrothrix aarhusensis]|uniref:NACHT domain-containing protein n=1 Tax=Candidatus Electrothrix aarhusensis TaxID=1859131 RepID=A0A3S3QBJ7_9BACT|nr:NACHT domain-containing protein [Candidatus Electrothrix aarhusensis]
MKDILPADWPSKLLEWLININQWNSPEGWLARVIIWLVAIYILIRILKYVLNEMIELIDKWTKLGLPVAISAEKKAKIRQRQQFCGVLRSDLASIAKAENWNDQFFTDLEAEVEAEGYYYTSAFNRLIRKKTSGLRKEPSLIKSIDRSAEQFLLLVGSPGSGKSVALRHLAHQLAERAIKSSGASERIPLYINLKELPSVASEKLTSDFIREFVLDNIRRGDADTVDYIRENWDEYRRKGIWFFLFDSFDEIPAVLHAPTGSQLIQQHSEAIRQFLAGMSSCRGVVASREFKGPETLPWQKFRILPLNSQKKEELIGNSFLKPQQKEIVRRHLATNESSIHNNPLFLTLLCRYVKEENAAPINDHDLLSRHIERLAYRDPDYTKKRYALTPEQLLQGATKLAVLFAENTELSLAPSQDEIAEILAKRGDAIDHLENLLAALIDVKIARSDVQEARSGDRRFTFSHRRYHETLFVHYLSENPDVIPPRELLTNLRWREYTVTLLQTQPLDVITGILEEAEQLLKEYAQAQEPVPILPEFGGHLSYYEWDDKIEVSLLNLLQEGFSKRIREIPEGISKQTAALLGLRWRDGDEYDRVMVLKTGGMLPQDVLVECLTYAVEYGSDPMRDVAFKKVRFLNEIPENLAKWLRGRLSDEVLVAKCQADILKLEALSSSLPDSVGSSFIFSRSLSVRKMNFMGKISFDKNIFFILIPISRSILNEKEKYGLLFLFKVTSLYSIMLLFASSNIFFQYHLK